MTNNQVDDYDDLLPEDEDSVDPIAYVEGFFAALFAVGLMLFVFEFSFTGSELLAVGGIGLSAAIIWEFKHDL